MIPIHIFWPLLLLLALPLSAQQTTIRLPQPDLTALSLADANSHGLRFAAPIPLDLSPATVGEWTRNNGINGRWELTFSLPGTHGLGIFLDQLQLPRGGKVYLLDFTGSKQTLEEQSFSGQERLFTGFLPEDQVKLVYEGPVFSDEEPAFRIWRADHVYRPDVYRPFATSRDFGNSNNCQVNANCPAGNGWEDEKSGAARIVFVVAEGSGYCSGNLINNTAEDGRPLILTGFHCQDGFTPLYDLWRFDFGFRSLSCEDPITPPDFTAYTGAFFRAGRQESDFLLLEIADPLFNAEEHYFAGWDRSDGAVSGDIYAFHHPGGDIQKMGRANSMSILSGPIDWNNGVTTPGNHHFRMNYNLGTFEVGASGSAVFDSNRRIRGSLNGGNFACPGSTSAFIGRLFQSWTGGQTATTRLSDWLDPLGLEPMTFDGQRLMGNTSARLVEGVARFDGTPISGVRLIFDWGIRADTVFTDTDGHYSLPRPAAATGLTISTEYRDGIATTGVNVVDIIAIRRHILALDTISPQQLLVADVNDSGNETIGDIVQISQVILGLSDWVERPNWIVYPTLLPIDPTPSGAFGPFNINIINSSAAIITLDFEVVKNGDVNFSAY